jgi:phosphatidylglycerol---prolipoprotein diacylglyceryl transferase
VKPVLFQFGNFAVHTYGVLVALGFFTGLWVASRLARRSGMNPDLPYELTPWLVFGGLGGARILYVASYWSRDFAGYPWWEPLAIWKGGLVFYGGLIGATIATSAAVLRRHLPYWKVADILMPGLALGHAFGRIGCLMNGCCYGARCSLPWAIHFPRGHETFPIRATDAIPVHPVQLYEAGLDLVLFALLAWLHRRRRFDGQLFSIYLLGYAVIRTFCELFRGDYAYGADPLAGRFTPGQQVSLFVFAAGVVIWFVRRNAPRAPTPA